MIEAVAGAGKTTALSLVARDASQKKIAPKRMRGLCFSNSAKNRFIQRNVEVGAPSAIPISTVEDFAKACIARLAHFGYLEPPALFESEDEVRPHLVKAAKAIWQKYEQKGGSQFDFAIEDNSVRVEGLLDLLFRLKASLSTFHFDDEEFDDETMALLTAKHDVDKEAIEICQEYELRRKPSPGYFEWQSAADHVTDLVSLLRLHPQALNAVPQCDLYLVDEWHDINAAEFELISIIRRGARLVVVGDGDQTIKLARGAEKRFTSSGFDQAFLGSGRLPLGKSRRCGPATGKLASRTTGNPFGSHPTAYTTFSKVTYDPDVDESCALKVVAKIEKLNEARAGTKYSDIAIVVREADQSIEIENALLDAEVPYRLEGLQTYLQRPEILMLRALLHIASGNYDTLVGDKETCEKMVAGLAMYFSVSQDKDDYSTDFSSSLSKDWKSTDTFLTRAKRDVVQNPDTLQWFFTNILCKAWPKDSDQNVRWKSRFAAVVAALGEQVQTASAGELLNYAAKQLDLRSATKRAFVSRDKANSAAQSVHSFISFAKRKNEGMNAEAFLTDIKARQLKVSKQMNYLRDRAQLVLTTVQASKGQEWPYVLMPYVESKQLVRSSDLGLEKRHFYVAITRAVDELTVFIPDDEHADLRSNWL